MTGREPAAPHARPTGMRRVLLVLLALVWVASACGSASSTTTEIACCAPAADARVVGMLVGIGGPAGAPVPHWQGTVSATGRGHLTVDTDPRGRFSLRLTPGVYRFTATSPTYAAGTCAAATPVHVRPHRTTRVRIVCPLR
jgi:hypothetical protein